MKTKYSSIVGILAILVLVASFVVPAKLAMPGPVAADPGLMEWTPVFTPDTDASSPATKQLFSPMIGTPAAEGGSEIIKVLVGKNGKTMYAITAQQVSTPATKSKIRLKKSKDGGVGWGGTIYDNLDITLNNSATAGSQTIVWDIAIAPDDQNSSLPRSARLLIQAVLNSCTLVPMVALTGRTPLGRWVLLQQLTLTSASWRSPWTMAAAVTCW